MKLSTSKMSSKGQVVIPEEIREAMNLQQGVKFIVIQEGDAVIFKLIEQPSPDEIKSLMDKAQSAIKALGVDESSVEQAIKDYRSEKKKH